MSLTGKRLEDYAVGFEDRWKAKDGNRAAVQLNQARKWILQEGPEGDNFKLLASSTIGE
jgi:hypothetical protein